LGTKIRDRTCLKLGRFSLYAILTGTFDSLDQQLFHADGEVAYAYAGSVIDGGRKRRGNAGEADLTYSARAIFV
jgi:hypothetical protein